LLVHSGSRGLGAAIAAHHTRVPHTPGGSNLGGLQIDSPGGHAYLTDHAWALSFARANRDALTTRALEVLADELGVAVDPSIPIDVHHNHVARERWRGRDLWVHRKGAIAIPTGAMALVPGSMATASYLVEGLGNDESFGSCSHGAGRVLTRGEARRRLSVADLSLAMRHVAYPEHLARHLVEEAPAVYRDIGAVLDDQRDLVRRRVRLEPVAVLKG
jgi:tRNA-splicing ligase RtcB